MATSEEGHLPNFMYIDRDGRLHLNGSSVALDESGTTLATGTMAAARTLSISDPVASSASIHPAGIQAMTADGAITIKSGLVTLSKAGVLAATLADPTATTDDGKVLRVVALTAQAHTISNAAGSGFNGAGASKDVATLGGAIGDGLTVVAYQGKWYVVGSVNATLG